MNRIWFEMREVRRRKLAEAVWIPLRASNYIEQIGHYGHIGYRKEFYGIGTLAVPIRKKQEADKLGWRDIGIASQHSGDVRDGEYIPADIYQHEDFAGLHLVLEPLGNSAENLEWHLHQDLVITLGLKREDDIWVRPSEDYKTVARLSREEDGDPALLEVRASHLRDYLCAREMALYVTSYRERLEISEDARHIKWPENSVEETDDNNRWEGHVLEIHEGGMPYGQKTAVSHIARTDVDPEDDVPALGLPTDDNITSRSWTEEYLGKKLYLVTGELWRTEWVEPASQSPIVRGDEVPSNVSFIIDAEGKQKSPEALIEARRWLWFRPKVMSELAERRGGSLNWDTRDTGSIACSPGHNVHFGVNSLGLINVYAKDIALLPEWQRKVWAGYNVSPEGKVSEELLASQAHASPANTQAPEEFLPKGLSKLNHLAEIKLGITLIKPHKIIPDLVTRVHRFRATDESGLFALAKDLYRLTAERFNVAALKQLVSSPDREARGSLKLLEKLLAKRVDPTRARKVMGPLVGMNELRKRDAHLPGQESNEAFRLVGVSQDTPYVIQGYQLLCACVSSIYEICEIIESWPNEEIEKWRKSTPIPRNK